jgi:hypothetical protein
MEMDSSTKATVLARVTPMIVSLGVGFAVAAAAAVITKLIGINMETSTMGGEVGLHPTDNDTSFSKTEASLTSNEAALAKDGLNATNSDISANQTDAQAMASDAKALDSGASAAQTKAGAMDIKTKGLVMS